MAQDELTDSRPTQTPRGDAESLHTQLLDAVGQAVIATDLAGRITYLNRAAEALYGWAADEVIGHNIVSIIPAPALREQAAEIMARLSTGASWSGEFQVRRRDGTVFPAIVTDAPLHNDRGELIGVVGITTDITDRVAARRELERNSRRIGDILESISDAFFALDEDLTITYINRVAEQVLDRRRDEVLGRRFTDAFPDTRGSIFEEKYRQAIREKHPLRFSTEFGEPPGGTGTK